MTYEANTVDEYIAQIPNETKEAFIKLRSVIKANLPEGFEETISYSMPAYVVPHSRYPDGYHCDPKVPLPFLSIASQKHFIALYHSGIYSMPNIEQWFREEYAKQVPGKLDMGKSCVRLKKLQTIPYDLIAELCRKITVEQWIDVYEKAIKK